MPMLAWHVHRHVVLIACCCRCPVHMHPVNTRQMVRPLLHQMMSALHFNDTACDSRTVWPTATSCARDCIGGLLQLLRLCFLASALATDCPCPC
jgi:hypothetical protein